jgi:DnaJ-class molecular chaperone
MSNKEIESLMTALFGDNGALTRMDRARSILLKDGSNWAMLNTADIRSTLTNCSHCGGGGTYQLSVTEPNKRCHKCGGTGRHRLTPALSNQPTPVAEK